MVALRLLERAGADLADVLRADELDPHGAVVAHDPAHELAEEVGGEILHEGHGTEDGPHHALRALRRLLDQVLLHVELGDEVGDHGGVLVGLCGPASVHGGVDEVLDVVGDRGVDEWFAFALFVFAQSGDGKDPIDAFAELLEDGKRRGYVALNNVDTAPGELDCGRGGFVASKAVDIEGGLIGEEYFDQSTALLAGCTDDEKLSGCHYCTDGNVAELSAGDVLSKTSSPMTRPSL